MGCCECALGSDNGGFIGGPGTHQRGCFLLKFEKIYCAGLCWPERGFVKAGRVHEGGCIGNGRVAFFGGGMAVLDKGNMFL